MVEDCLTISGGWDSEGADTVKMLAFGPTTFLCLGESWCDPSLVCFKAILAIGTSKSMMIGSGPGEGVLGEEPGDDSGVWSGTWR